MLGHKHAIQVKSIVKPDYPGKAINWNRDIRKDHELTITYITPLEIPTIKKSIHKCSTCYFHAVFLLNFWKEKEKENGK